MSGGVVINHGRNSVGTTGVVAVGPGCNNDNHSTQQSLLTCHVCVHTARRLTTMLFNRLRSAEQGNVFRLLFPVSFFRWITKNSTTTTTTAVSSGTLDTYVMQQDDCQVERRGHSRIGKKQPGPTSRNHHHHHHHHYYNNNNNNNNRWICIVESF